MRLAADFAFYGNKLFQSTFIALLYPHVSRGQSCRHTSMLSILRLAHSCVDVLRIKWRSWTCSQLSASSCSPCIHGMCLGCWLGFPPDYQLPEFAYSMVRFAQSCTVCAVMTSLCLIHPVCCILQATPFERMQWTVLNSAVSLMGYWAAAALVDKKW